MDDTILKIAQEIRDRVRSANPGKTVWTDNICEMMESKEKLLAELIAMKITDDLIGEMFFQYANHVLSQIAAKSKHFSFQMFAPTPVQKISLTKIKTISKSMIGRIVAENPGKIIYTLNIQQFFWPKHMLISELYSMNLPEPTITDILVCYVNHNI